MAAAVKAVVSFMVVMIVLSRCEMGASSDEDLLVNDRSVVRAEGGETC